MEPVYRSEQTLLSYFLRVMSDDLCECSAETYELPDMAVLTDDILPSID